MRKAASLLGRDVHGTAVVEFAITAMLVILIACGTMEVGRMLWISHTVQLAASDAVRFASLHGAGSGAPATRAEITAFATSHAPFLSADRISVSVAWAPDNSPNSTVTIEIGYAYDSLFGNMLPFDGIDLRASAASIIIN